MILCKKTALYLSLLFTVVFFLFPNSLHASYPTSGNFVSTDILDSTVAVTLINFSYDVSSLPANTSISVQFSQDASVWYSSAGVLDVSDTLSVGSNSIDLSGLGWTGPHFYYKMTFASSDGVSTPVLDSIGLSYSVFIGLSSQNYRIPFSSLNSSGLDVSDSENYLLSDTIGEVGTGPSSSETFKMRAGYRQMVGGIISISAPDNVLLTNIGGLGGGSSSGSAVWTVTTDNEGGYSLSINTTTNPALRSSTAEFSNYSPVGEFPDYNFSVSSTQSVFGFSASGVDVTDSFRNDEDSCNSGSLSTVGFCWDGLSTLSQVISERTTSNHTNGSETTVEFRAAIGADKFQESGDYQAEIVMTAVMI